MKLLLTSGGLQNESIKKAFSELVGKPYAEAHVAYAITASTGTAGDHAWTIGEMTEVFGLGWKTFDIIDFASLPAADIAKRLKVADVLYTGGGNVYWLAQAMGRPDVKPFVESFLQKKVYAGVSAGSMVFSRQLTDASAELFGETAQMGMVGGHTSAPFGYFDWYLKPHYQSPIVTPPRSQAWIKGIAAQVGYPIYCIDDQTAVRVVGDAVEIISEGQWLHLNKKA